MSTRSHHCTMPHLFLVAAIAVALAGCSPTPLPAPAAAPPMSQAAPPPTAAAAEALPTVAPAAATASEAVPSEAPATAEAAPTEASAAAATYADPFAYCAAVGTIDAPDARYTGPKTPDSVLPAPAGGGTPPPFPEGSVYWRCMDGKVYTCVVGANIPCWDKADTSAAPNTGIQNFCKDQPNADVIPAVAAGRETIYEWSCKDGAPVMGKQVFQVDAQGYITSYWQEIPNPSPTPAASGLQPPSPEVCNGMAQAMMQALNTEVTQAEAPVPFTDPASGASGAACQAAATGTGKQFTSPDAVIKAIAAVLTAGGWKEDPQLAAGGPTGMSSGFRSGDLVCLAAAGWKPDASANCPKDQPISACEVTPEQQLYSVTIDCAQPAAATPAASADPLPSWNEGPVKTAILKFVADVTAQDGPSYVSAEERIAVFDNDGTLWAEKPVPAQAAFIFARIAELAPDNPDWQTTQPYQAVLERDAKTLASLGEEDIAKLVAATHAGMTEEEFMATAKAFLETARHPRFDVLYTQTVYQPMLELLALLRTNGFETYIVSGGGAQFMRVFAEEVYGVRPENVIGSSLQYELRPTADGTALYRLPELATFNDRGMKPANIQRHIGRRPILAGGNSDGDLAMFQYTGGAHRPYLNLLIVHDDAEREYDDLTGTDAVMAAAAQSPWQMVSMKKDFKVVFPPQVAAAGANEPAAAPGAQAGLANPASQNCTKQGGKLSLEERPGVGQFGVCYFEDNLQCEEWALMRGECPVGGVKVTGYATAAARFCAISGGEYAITAGSGTENEQGTCTVKNGVQCDAQAYYTGTCSSSAGAGS